MLTNELPLPKDYLAAEFKRRLEVNASYTMRAFARDLGTAPARISEIFSGRQGISPKAAMKLAAKLRLSDDQTTYFVDLCAAKFGRSPKARELALERLQLRNIDGSQQQLTEDTFAAVASWYHFAFLELLDVNDFQCDIPWIAKRLGLSEQTVTEMLDRLERLRMIAKDANGRWKAATNFTFSPNGIPSDAVKQHHREMLSIAGQSLEQDPIETRDFSSMMVAIDKSRVAEAATELKTFRRNFAKKYSNSAEKDSVFVLCMQLFQVDRGNRQ